MNVVGFDSVVYWSFPTVLLQLKSAMPVVPEVTALDVAVAIEVAVVGTVEVASSVLTDCQSRNHGPGEQTLHFRL